MSKKMKLKLDDLKIQSFVTSEDKNNNLKGGSHYCYTVLCDSGRYTINCCETDDSCNLNCNGSATPGCASTACDQEIPS